ncbi:LytR/AlgR family response regulator transcription factor [Negadavirga shengliensis]|uniref:LytR/AlgR family response regulator transcription factor n=1 Tax=Negadavirga shengliensis TaxID=1389218 RepID=A0ABV9T7E8_9BACT
MNVSIRNMTVPRKIYHLLFWLVVTVIFLYDRRYLIQKFNLPDHFIECVTVRLLLVISLVYFHLYYLVPRYFRARRYTVYALLLFSALIVYVSLQNLYDIYLYGYVIGDLASRDFWHAFPYNFVTISWYLLLTAALKVSLDWYEERKKKTSGTDLSHLQHPNGQEKIVFLKTGTRQIKTNLDHVTHVKGLKDYSIVFTKQEQIIVKGSLKTTEKLLADKKLVRVHKSYMVALDLIKTINDNHIILDGHTIPIGRSYKKDLYKLLAI